MALTSYQAMLPNVRVQLQQLNNKVFQKLVDFIEKFKGVRGQLFSNSR